jgi:signal transduction histidine kinase
MLSANPELMRVQWLLSGLTALFILIWQAPAYYSVQGLANYLPAHMFAETFSIVVAMLVFGVAWNAYSAVRPGNIIILACALFAVGIIDFAHTLSFKGMPDFVTPSGTEKAINLWLSARLVAALALFAVAIRSWGPLADPRSRYWLLAGGLAVAIAVSWLGVAYPDVWPHTFVPGQGLTPLKIGAEFAIVVVLLVPAVLFYRQARVPQTYDAASLFAATVITILGELCFMLYSDVADIFNLLGHFYKIVAYFFIYRAVFVASVREPFQRLDTELAENRRMSEELERYRDHLEELVVKRTAQLEAANKELEAFSYSVSHDLRAPLRSIDGFSQILLKKYQAQLDEFGNDYLVRVRRASQRMGQLIDDLLQLSRVTRSEIRQERIDLSGIAQNVVEELRKTEPARQVQFELQQGLQVHADPGLLRVVLENLLGNAWKFTSKKADPKIEFGVCDKDGGFFVRDNGDGFNMDYVHKLFGAFQRLHSANEFEGTGIGLATVQRIIHRHHGRVRAEGKEGEGATFYFTLPETTYEV